MSWTRLPPRVLTCRVLPYADARLCESLGVVRGERRSLGFVTCDQDDSLYAALDHATKMARVEVIYAKSFYAGAAHASGPLSGEAIGVLAAPDPDELTQGLAALRSSLDGLFSFYTAETGGPAFFPTVIESCGEYLAKEASLAPGVPLGYFIAPPVEALVGLDAALKAAEVKLVRFFGPPTETNFAGGYVSGAVDAVHAAARAFADAVVDVAGRPIQG